MCFYSPILTATMPRGTVAPKINLSILLMLGNYRVLLGGENKLIPSPEFPCIRAHKWVPPICANYFAWTDLRTSVCSPKLRKDSSEEDLHWSHLLPGTSVFPSFLP